MSSVEYLQSALSDRILFLDGGMGTRIQAEKLSESDYRGLRFSNHSRDLKGNNELLSLTRPDLVKQIHTEFLEAGSDIIETNTFNATRISQAEYGLEDTAFEMNVQSARVAREACEEMFLRTGRRCLVAGAIGPTSKTLSVSPSVEDPSFRSCTWEDMVSAYYEQVEGLLTGGVDILLVETIFDTLNAKAAVFAISDFYENHPEVLPVPLMISVTIVDLSGRTLSGQTVDAFWISIAHANPFCVGINCALGAEQMRPFLSLLSATASCYIHVYPNAGLPNAMGGYDETPIDFAGNMLGFAKEGLVNIMGGCCGTSPEHIRELVRMVREETGNVRQWPDKLFSCMQLSGLEPLVLHPDIGFVNIGERCNLMGSVRFKKLIVERKYDLALEVAKEQALSGAQILDFNFDADLIDGKLVMGKFMRICATEPAVAQLPFMIDSSKWEVIEEGLKYVQGKCVVNSISLKGGETEFIRLAKKVKKFGAALVVMAFDEIGQATTCEGKVDICKRSYDILVGKVGFNPSDIIFDPNILTIATGMTEHDEYALNFIRALPLIHGQCPGAYISGGLSNLSFSFRGLTSLREMIHAVFLFHAIPAGLDMAIVNAGALPIYEDIPERVRELLTDLILNRRDVGEEMLALAEAMRQQTATGPVKIETESWRSGQCSSRLSHALIHGIDKYVEEDVLEAVDSGMEPLSVIEGPLMNGMTEVGRLFGSGKMFLPQVIKSARVMKKAVAILTPLMEANRGNATIQYNGTIVLATVKGDVHDIGKNIVGVVLGCNNYRVVDLGVMVSVDKILEAVKVERADILGLSGLITPSLDEMVHVADVMEANGLSIPLLIGGATTSRKHTAVKISPKYKNKTVHVLDASRAVPVVQSLMSKDKDIFLDELAEDYHALVEEYEQSLTLENPLTPLVMAREKKFSINWSMDPPASVTPEFLGPKYFPNYSLASLLPFIDWRPFFHTYQLRGRYPNKDYPGIFADAVVGVEAQKHFDEAQEMLREIVCEKWISASAVIGIWRANSTPHDDIVVSDDDGNIVGRFHGLRQQSDQFICISDFVAPEPFTDYIAGFVCQAGNGVSERKAIFHQNGDIDKAIMLDALADRLAEAMAEKIHMDIRRKFWGYSPNEQLSIEDMFKVKYQGIRPAGGYPTQPDHREKKILWDLLDVEKITSGEMNLTSSYMMTPAASVSALCFSHPTSKYFGVGPIDKDQVVDYARRTGHTVDETEKWLGSTVVGYR